MKKYLILFSFFAIFFNLALFSNDTYAAVSGKCLRVIFTVTNRSATGGGAKTEKSSDWLCAKTDDKGNTTTRLGIYEYKLGDRIATKHASAYKSGTALVITAKNDSNKIQFHGGAGTSMKAFTVKTNGVAFSSISSGVKDGFSKTSPVVDSTQNSYEYKGIDDDKSLQDVLDDIANAESDESSEASGEDADPCYSGAGVLGHMICPLLKAFGELADTAYVDLIQPALMLEPELVSESSGTFAGWQIFQNFANIAFIIMLLIIVLSQVTGIGLSNYGIKKTLPKLVVAVVLINISYIICQLAVDLSNVLGVGLKSLMDGLTQQIHETMELNEVVFNADATTSVDKWDWGSTLASLALLGGIIAGVGTLLSQGFAVLLPLLLVAVAVIIGIMFFFILLSVRKAGVVLLVVLSPIAFVCYMLPNTKKLFDKWYKAFTGLLLLFPICGLIIGGGDFASEILLSVNEDSGKCDFFFALTAMVIGVLPIFFIPLILKNSMTALGNIGAKLSGMGSRFSNRTRGSLDKAVRNSDRYQGWERSNALRRANRISNRYQKRSDRLAAQGKTLSDSQMRRYARNQALVAKDFDENLAAREAVLTNTHLSNEELQNKLTKSLNENDRLGIMATQNVLASRGEDGRQAIHKAMKATEIKDKEGNVIGSTASAAAAKTYSTNIMDNYASDFMSSSRSTFDYAKKVQDIDASSGSAPSISKFEADSAQSLKASNLPGMDEDELNRYIARVQANGFDATEEEGLKSLQALQAVTQEAMSNENIKGSLKDKQLEKVQQLHDEASRRLAGSAEFARRKTADTLYGDSGKLH